MENLLSGAIGGIIGTIIAAGFSYIMFKQQVRIDSNRFFLNDMIDTIRRIYLSVLQNKLIEDKDINYIISFQAMDLKDFKDLNTKLTAVRTVLVSYNNGLSTPRVSPTSDTTPLQIVSKSDAETSIKRLFDILRTMV